MDQRHVPSGDFIRGLVYAVKLARRTAHELRGKRAAIEESAGAAEVVDRIEKAIGKKKDQADARSGLAKRTTPVGGTAPWEHGAIHRAVQMLHEMGRKNESADNPYGGLAYTDDADALRLVESHLVDAEQRAQRAEAECERLKTDWHDCHQQRVNQLCKQFGKIRKLEAALRSARPFVKSRLGSQCNQAADEAAEVEREIESALATPPPEKPEAPTIEELHDERKRWRPDARRE